MDPLRELLPRVRTWVILSKDISSRFQIRGKIVPCCQYAQQALQNPMERLSYTLTFVLRLIHGQAQISQSCSSPKRQTTTEIRVSHLIVDALDRAGSADKGLWPC
jgi:hypothetical protein